jgi:hypothetical protein
MLTKEENRLITLTGPGTAGGAPMRCYWHPIGEELILFRDDRGRRRTTATCL